MSSEALERAKQTVREALEQGVLSHQCGVDSIAAFGTLLAEVARLEQERDEAFAQEDEWMRQRDSANSQWRLQRDRALAAEAALAVAREREQRAVEAVGDVTRERAAVGLRLHRYTKALQEIAGLRVASPYGARIDAAQARSVARAALVDEPAAATDPGSSSGKTPGFDPGDAGSIPAPGMQRLREALVAAAIPLEVLAGQIRTTPYRELTDELQAEIERAVLIVRAALVDEPAAATLAEPEQAREGEWPDSPGDSRPSVASDEPRFAPAADDSSPGSASAAADEPCDEACREEGKCSGYCAGHGDPVAAADEPDGVEGTVPAQWYLDLKRENQRLRAAADEPGETP